MTNPLTEARTFVKDTLQAEGFNAFGYPPDSATLPAVWMLPDDPWSTPVTLASSYVNLRVKVTGSSDSRTRDALPNLEERAWQAIAALTAKGARVMEVRAPETLTLGNLTVHAVELRVSLLLQDDEGA